MLLTEKQTHRLEEQNRESRSKPMGIWENDFQQKSQKHTVEKGKLLQ